MELVVFINCFEVPEGAEEEFLTLWREVNAYARTKDGYLGHTLHQSLSTSAVNRYVNVALWASERHFTAATDEHFRRLVGSPAWARFRSTPALYEVVDRVAPA